MKEKIKKLRSTERGNAAFKLGLYLLFFLGVAAFLLTANKTTPRQNSFNESITQNSTTNQIPDVRSYFEKQQLLTQGKYEFKYTIDGPIETIFIGEYDNGSVTGYKETKDDLIKYSIEDGEVYIEKLSQKEKYDDLYTDLDETIFDFENLFKKLNDDGPVINREDDIKIYTYSDFDDYTYIVRTDENYIIGIDIYNDDFKYRLEFSY